MAFIELFFFGRVESDFKDSWDLQQLYVPSFAFLGSIRKDIVEVSHVYKKLIYKLNLVKVKVTKPHI